MTRVKKGKTRHRKREKILKKVKGFRWNRKSKYRLAKDALYHALKHAYRGRKEKKRKMRRLWQTQISASCKQAGMSYSKFIFGLKQKRVQLDRKILAQLAQKEPEIFAKIVSKIKN